MSLQASGNADPGRLDRRVSLQYGTATRDAVGGESIAWTELATVWASKQPVRGSRLDAGEGRHSEAVIVYRIRHRDDITAFMRLVHGDDIFEIVAPPEEAGRRQFLDLTCRALDQTPGDNRDFLDVGDGTTPLDVGDGSTPIDAGSRLAA